MSSSGISPPSAKTCIWLQSRKHIIPLELLKSPSPASSQMDNVKFGFIDDKFEIHVVKSTDFYLRVAIYRNPANPNKKHDDGYALRFYTTVTGFDEGPQVSIMNHDDEKAQPISFFKLSEKILAKITTTHQVFDLFVVAEMLEFKNTVDENSLAKKADELKTSYLINNFTKKEYRDLCFILKSSPLEIGFTGRLPSSYMTAIVDVFAKMSPNFGKIIEYLKARCNSEDSADISSVLKYVGFEDKRGPIPLDTACIAYILVHKIGFHCMKIIASDYLLSFLGKDCDNILNILEVALIVHDEHLFDKAMFSFLNSFHEIVRSKKFEDYSKDKPSNTRLIIHSARVWIKNNDVYIPGWKQSDQPTTES